MQLFEVGGSIRDELLGIKAHDRDWVVVGSTPAHLLSNGFKQVGRDFPVFLHPETQEEYALARTERKTGQGYTGFSVRSSPDVSLEEDLLRRDLTINAMAKAPDGTLIDPYNGQKDLANRILRHVSPAFVEDPLRVFRVARFLAKLAPYGFSIAPETQALMKEIVTQGELLTLTAERVWVETQRSLCMEDPVSFFQTLESVNALDSWFPEISALFGVPQCAKYHPEIDSGEHTLMVLAQAVSLTCDPITRFCAVVHDIGKALTPESEWPNHQGHEERAEQPIKQLAKRLMIPKNYLNNALLVAKWHGHLYRWDALSDQMCLALFTALDAFRRPEQFERLMICGIADARGRKTFEQCDVSHIEHWRGLLLETASLPIAQLLKNNPHQPPAVLIEQARLAIVQRVRAIGN